MTSTGPGTHTEAHDDHHGHGHEYGQGHGHGHGGHDHGDHAAMFRDRLWVTLALSLPVLYYSEHLRDWFGYEVWEFTGHEAVSPVLGTVIFLYGGWPFLTGGFDEARARRPGMMLLISLAITVAYGASLATSLGWFDVEVWWELALLILIMLLGHWLEMRAIEQAGGALDALAELIPDEAERVTPAGDLQTVSTADLGEGDVVLVRPGGRVPADGVVIEGTAELDESMITGESHPVTRGPGDPVVAGTVAVASSVRVEVTATGEGTALAGIQRLVAAAQESASPGQMLADRAAGLLFYVALGAAAVTVVVWSALGNADAAVSRAVTVLIIACPHALGLAIPLVVSISTTKAAQHGILVADRQALEKMREVDVVLFDKTGTLTQGSHALTGLISADGTPDDDRSLLALAAAAEADSEHPLARAIVAAAAERGVEVPVATGFQSMAGRGVVAEVGGGEVAVGGPALMSESGLGMPHQLTEQVATWQAQGAAVLAVVTDNEVRGAMAFADQVRPESHAAIGGLKAAGVRVAMVTGDARSVADTVAAELGIDEVFAEVLPEDKDAAVAELQQRGEVVAMVGDGINDAPALARADVGIAIGAGTDVALASAGIVLASDDPQGVGTIRRLSAATYRKMVQNLWWAAGYNLLAIPLAAGVLAWAGFVLPMAVGAVLMSASTVVVALNAQLLRRVDLAPTAD